MQYRSTLRKAVEFGVALNAVVVLFLAGCGGGAVSSTSGGVTSATVVPFKGPFLNGYIVLKDANGNVVSLISGGIINASGVAEVTFDSDVAYPLIVEVSGDYYNEITGGIETGTVPLRSLIASASEVSASSAIPVTIVTETAVADLQNRLGAFSANNPIEAASAVAALQMAGLTLGIPATAVPSFDPVTNKTSDPDTLRLAALAVVAGNQPAGATLAEKIKLLAHKLATISPASAPIDVISQAEFDNALAAMTSGASSVMAAGVTPPAASYISSINSGVITSLCNQIQGGLMGGGEVISGSSVTGSLNVGGGTGGLVGGNYVAASSVGQNYGVILTGSASGGGQIVVTGTGTLANSGGGVQSGGITLALAVVPTTNTQVPAANISWATYSISGVTASSGVDLAASGGLTTISGVDATIFNGSFPISGVISLPASAVLDRTYISPISTLHCY